MTAVGSKNNDTVDRMPRHILDVHKIVDSLDDESGGEEENKAPSLQSS